MGWVWDQVAISIRWLDVLVAPAVISLAVLWLISALFAVFEAPPGGFRARLAFFLRTLWFYLGCTVPVLLLGVIVGYITGYSRTPIAGTLLTAMLTLAGGLVAYAFGKDSQYRVAVGVCVSVFALNVLLGLQYGSYHREHGRLERLEMLAVQERRVRNIRKSLELEAEYPAWVLGGEPVSQSR